EDGMRNTQQRRLLRASAQLHHRMVEAEIVNIVPGCGDRCRDDADHADMLGGHVEDERAERYDDKKSDDLEADGVTDTVACLAHFLKSRWAFRVVPALVPITGEVVLAGFEIRIPAPESKLRVTTEAGSRTAA